MKTDVRGCSTCARGSENFETYRSPITRKKLCQYDYRHHDGELFTCVGKTIKICREKRDRWLASGRPA